MMKKQFCRVISLVLVIVSVLTLCACGEKEYSNKGSQENGKLVWYLGGNNIMAGVDPQEVFKEVADSVDPAQVYASVTLDAQMLRGAYTLNNKEKDLKTVRKEIPFENVNFDDGAVSLTALPTSVYLGAEHICNSQTRYNYSHFEEIEEYEVAVIELASEEGLCLVPCTYEVSGNTITFKQITRTSKEEEPLTYEFTGLEWNYNLTLSGPYLTFTKGGSSLQLKAYCLTENTEDTLSLHGYSLPDSPLIDGLDYFASADAWNYAVRRDGSYYDISAYKMDDAGRFTVYLAEKDLVSGEKDEFVDQYTYIIQSSGDSFFTDFGIILLDGSKTYYYTDTITMREARALKEQGADVGTLTDDEIKEIAEKKANLFDDLYEAFSEKGIKATIDRSTGEIALDSTVLFGVNESVVSDEGKAFLKEFMGVYTSVVFGDEYEGFISKIMVEGHTDTSGSYELNQKLSKERADSVKDYCLSPDCGIDAAYTETLQGMLEAVGYAYDKPVYDANGEVDMDASRRVSFRFVVNVKPQG